MAGVLAGPGKGLPLGMSLKLRLLLLMGLLLGLILGWLSLLQMVERRQSVALLGDVRRERMERLDRGMEMQGDALQRFVNDYTLWDEMVEFVRTGDRAWAKINIDVSLETFEAVAVWIFRTDGGLLYEAHQGDWRGLTRPPLGTSELLEWLQRPSRGRIFVESEAGVLELCAAPVQPSIDADRETPAQGWMVAARVWDEAHLDTLGKLVGGQLRLMESEGRETGESETLMRLWRPLPAIDGRVVRWLELKYEVAMWAQVLRNDRSELWVFAGSGMLMFGFLSAALVAWVLKPLGLIDLSLARDDVGVLQPLLRRGVSVELGRVARMIEASAVQKAVLCREVVERRRIEQALRDRDAEVQRAYANLAELGRNLHDSVIQSLYATGMGLSSVAKLCRTRPVEAVARLEQAQQTLNETIAEVRGFIAGMEPEALKDRTFRQAVEDLVNRMRAVYPCAATINVSDSDAQLLTLPVQAHVLQIAREALSNALRHGEAKHVQIGLEAEDGRLAFTIEDDGRGFDPANLLKPGLGLTNIDERAREIGGRLTVSSTPGKGTLVKLTLPRPATA